MTVVAPDIQLKASWLTTIGAICDRFSGEVQTGPFGSQLHAADYSDTGTPVVMPQDMVAGSIVTDRIARVGQEHVDRLGTHVMRTGDIVLSRRGDVARFAVVTDRESGWLCGTGCIRIRLNSKDIDVRYVRHYLQQNSVRSWLEHNAKGVTMANLNTGIIRRLPFAYPPITEQRRIAAILDQADALRAKRREALAELDGLAQAIFVEMFGDAFWDSDNQVNLGQIADIITGFAFRSDEYVMEGDRIRLCRGTNVLPGRIDWADLACWPTSKSSGIQAFSLAEGDIVLAMDRPWISEGFKIAKISAADCPSLLVQRVARIRANSSNSTEFIYMLLKQEKFARHCKPTETTIPHISPKEIRSFSFKPPSASQLHIFSIRIQAIESLKATHRTALTELDALFASLQHRAFRGEL